MPRNVSCSPHEPQLTRSVYSTPRASAQRAGRILADRIVYPEGCARRESKAKIILMSAKGPLRNQRLFYFSVCEREPLSPQLAHMADRCCECPGSFAPNCSRCCSQSAPILILIRQLESAATELQLWRRGMPPYKCCQEKGRNHQENGN